ncbi:MAG: transporter substrate-binding domain-containing protein [Hyphomicrobiaceae bacterium]|nr:transporter substrate-binding domain-containing protein [Hyphomicrobiaceae bacterium]
MNAPSPLRVGTTGDYRPLTWRDPDTGRFSGRDIGMVSAFAAAQGRKPAFIATTWAAMLDDLAAGRFEMAVGGISRTPDRAEAALLSDTIETTGKVAVVRRGEQERYRTMEDIDREGVRVVENRGGTNERFGLERIRHAEMIIVPDNHEPFDFLRGKKADVMFTDSVEADYLERQKSGLCAANTSAPFTHVDKVFLFGKDQRVLQQDFNRWLVTHHRA